MNNSRHVIAVAMTLAILTISACKKDQAEAPAVSAATPDVAPAVAEPAEAPTPSAEQLAKAADENSQALTANDTTWTPEALEELLAPIALYPDSVLEQVLVASTNPQEVLDAGNWLFDNKALKGKALDEAADEKGFTPPVLALVQFPETNDMLCQQMTWTTELGQAYVNDQAGVLDAVQRLRRQARDVGSLQSSPKLTVASEKINKVEYVTVSSPSPETVYVPRYDPVAVYVPQSIPESSVATQSSTTVIKQGHSTGALLLAFGAGILVNEIFDNRNDRYCRRYYYSHRCRGGSYWARPPIYYPPYPYRPHYGNGFYPSHKYHRPSHRPGQRPEISHRPGVNQRPGLNNHDNPSYWNRYDQKRRDNRHRVQAQSPITAARPKRDDLDNLNRMAAKGPLRAAPRKGTEFSSRDQFIAAQAGQAGLRDAAVQGTYKGARPGAERDRIATGKAAGLAATRELPKVQGSYKGLNRDIPTTGLTRDRVNPAQKPAIADKARPAAKPAIEARPAINRPIVDRGYGNDRPQTDRMARPENNRPQTDRMARPENNRPQTDRMARPENNRPQTDRMARPENNRPQTDRMARPENNRPQTDRMARPAPSDNNRPLNDRMARPAPGDNNRPQNDRMARPESSLGNRLQNRSERTSAVSDSNRNGAQERAASQRGKQSLPDGIRNQVRRRDRDER